MEPIRICIGTEPRTELARRVLEASVLRHTSAAVEFHPMMGGHWELPDIPGETGTGFSLRRWLIPAFFNWAGRAIYLDADQIVLDDIRELWEAPQHWPAEPDPVVWLTVQPDRRSIRPRYQTSVMLIDCARAQTQFAWRRDWMLDWLRQHPGRDAYLRFMHGEWMTSPKPGVLPDVWNCLDTLLDRAKLLHYTRVPDQPWQSTKHPHAALWEAELRHGLRSGRIARSIVAAELAAWRGPQRRQLARGLHPHFRATLEAA